ncbi:MAG: response regulator [Janthinobacterium lividum]
MDPSRTSSPDAEDTSDASSSGLRVLVVEDVADSRDALCELLGLLGYAPVGAASGEAAFECLQSQAFDVLLTDITLPGISGVELATRAVAQWPGLRIVFASGYGAPPALPFESISLLKPYTTEHLEQALDGRAPASASRY